MLKTILSYAVVTFSELCIPLREFAMEYGKYATYANNYSYLPINCTKQNSSSLPEAYMKD